MPNTIPSQTKRYKLGSYRHYSEVLLDQYCDVPCMQECPDGEYVKYEALAEAERRVRGDCNHKEGKDAVALLYS